MACLRVVQEICKRNSRFYCISGALRGLRFQNFPDPPVPEGSLATPPPSQSKNAAAVRAIGLSLVIVWLTPGHRMTSRFFYDFTASRSSREPPSGKFSSTALVVRDVQQTQTAVPDSIVVRKNSGTSLASVVRTVLENLVVQAMIVVARARLATLITDVRICLRINPRICFSHHG